MRTRILLAITLFATAVAPCSPASAAKLRTGLGAPMLAQWKSSPELNNGNLVKGSVVITNQSDDDFDQTVVVEAINQYGRAVVIGYQHFPLVHHTSSVPIPFNMTLPPGQYQIHADAVAEVPKKNAVHRLHMQAPQSLEVDTI